MLIDVKVPVLAESVAEATLLNWQKKVGDHVKRGDNLIDIETDKVTLEVSALNDGVVAEILKNDGDTVQSDEVIAKIDTEAKSAKPADKEAAPKQQSLPDMDTPDKDASAAAKLSPAVRNLLEENNIAASDVKHAGDRITKEDVLRHLGKADTVRPAASKPAPAPEAESASAPKSAPEPTKPEAPQNVMPKAAAEPVTPPKLTTSTGDRPEEVVPMTRLRKRTAERLLGAQHENAILTTFNEVNLQAVTDIRNRYKADFEKTHDVKLGFMSFFTRAAIEALKKFPIINASIDGDNIIYHGYFDIGIAVSSQRGLVVPILRD
ncbi:MAG: 2-oxo acid dehydrogenase subunit E2, partial [Gammaproteobacteria bacterium]